MREEVQADFIRDAMEGQHGVVEINLVRLVVVPKLLGAFEKLLDVSRVRRVGAERRIPFQRLPDGVVLRV